MKRMNRRGQGMTEYLILVGAIVVAVVAFWPQIQKALDSKIATVTSEIAKP